MREQVVVVEADAVLGAVLAEVLRHSGYEVTFVRTLIGEIERIDSVSAVILDIDTTAAERELAWLSLLEPCCDSPPIVLLGVQVPEDMAQHLRSHSIPPQSKNFVWVQKPFRNEDLLAAVRQAQEEEGCVSGQVERKECSMRCERCAGLVVPEHVSAGAPSVGSWASGEWRCVNCGAVGISDPVHAHAVTRGMVENKKVDGQRRPVSAVSRRS